MERKVRLNESACLSISSKGLMALSHNFSYISTSVLFSVIIGLELSFDLVLLMYFFFLQLITSSVDHAIVDQEITVRNV